MCIMDGVVIAGCAFGLFIIALIDEGIKQFKKRLNEKRGK